MLRPVDAAKVSATAISSVFSVTARPRCSRMAILYLLVTMPTNPVSVGDGHIIVKSRASMNLRAQPRLLTTRFFCGGRRRSPLVNARRARGRPGPRR
jgi:hypothetical protein